MNAEIRQKYELWLQNAVEDPDLVRELRDIEGQEDAIEDRFYRELEFGTGGLRGVIGAGENRMNIYTVRKATQGLADYLNGRYETAAVSVSFDSRIKSDLFAREAARVLAANGITVHLFPELEPTPVLSYAVRQNRCQAGIMVTASHNPAKYNGYKCYGPDGCQMTDHDASEVTAYIRKVDLFRGVKTVPFDEALADGRIVTIADALLESYMDCVLSRQVNAGVCGRARLSVVYTPSTAPATSRPGSAAAHRRAAGGRRTRAGAARREFPDRTISQSGNPPGLRMCAGAGQDRRS